MYLPPGRRQSVRSQCLRGFCGLSNTSGEPSGGVSGGVRAEPHAKDAKGRKGRVPVLKFYMSARRAMGFAGAADSEFST
jgi:hypothetical protein